MRIIDGEQTLMRIFIGESDKYDGRPLYNALVEFFRKEKIAGATVFRGIEGFGAKSHFHTANILRLSQDLPIVIEVVDSSERLEEILPKIDPLIHDGLITMEKVRVVRYAPHT